jgi:hypothetical protein
MKRTFSALLLCTLLYSCNKIELPIEPQGNNNNELILIAYETYFKSSTNEYDFYIITYCQEIAEAIQKIGTEIQSEDQAKQFLFSGDNYLNIETIIENIKNR